MWIETASRSVTPRNSAEPRALGVKKGCPDTASKIRNQTATTAAPISPATIPSVRMCWRRMIDHQLTSGAAPIMCR